MKTSSALINDSIKPSTVDTIVCLLLILLFTYSSISKLINFEGFEYDLNKQPFSNALTPVLAFLIPAVEIALVVLLSFDRTRKTGMYLSLVLMVIFTVYTCLVLLHAFEYVPCSCGGVIGRLTWPQHLVFNLFFVGVSVVGIRYRKG